jgi:hypothetical protein
MSLDLQQLTQLQPLFKLLSAGTQLNRFQDSKLWVELENHLQDYTALFAALGFALVLDGRGFAYFKTDQATSYTGKLTRKLALLLMLLFEYQADQGLHLMQFQHWRLDAVLVGKLCQHYHAILEAEEMGSLQALKEIMDTAARIGFMQAEDRAYRLLPAVHRYLDLFQELAQAERPDQPDTESEDGLDDGQYDDEIGEGTL